MKSVTAEYNRNSNPDRLTANFVASLLGMLEGIYCDLRFREKEMRYLHNFLLNFEWLSTYSEYGYFAYSRTLRFLQWAYELDQNSATTENRILEVLEELQDDVASYCDELFIYMYKEESQYQTNFLIGLCKGLISDDVIAESEVRSLVHFLEDHKRLVIHSPVCVPFKKVLDLDLDNLTADDFADVKKLVTDFCGGDEEIATGYSLGESFFDAPDFVSVAGRKVVLTGKFKLGSRAKCEEIITALGGEVVGSVRGYVAFVIMGALNSDHWRYENFGSKVERALKLKEEGYDIKIISEDQWLASMPVSEAVVFEKFASN